MSGNSTGWDETPFYSQLKQALGVDDWPEVQLIVPYFIDKMQSCLKGEATFFSSVNTAETVSGCLEIEKNIKESAPSMLAAHQVSYVPLYFASPLI